MNTFNDNIVKKLSAKFNEDVKFLHNFHTDFTTEARKITYVINLQFLLWQIGWILCVSKTRKIAF